MLNRQRTQSPAVETELHDTIERESGSARMDRRHVTEYADPVDDTLDDSFPASDPPPWSGLTLGGSLMEHRAGDGDDVLTAVQRMFAAFTAGDVDALLETVHESSKWTYYGANPGLASVEFEGHAAVRKFFVRILERLEMSEFNTDEFVVQGDTVVIFGSEAGTVRATGRVFRNVWTQKYVVRDGLIVRMVEYNIQTEPNR